MRLLALFFTVAAMLFFWSVVYANMARIDVADDFPRSLMLTIFRNGLLLGGLIGALPTLLASGIALTYRNEKVDGTFYLAVFTICLTLVALFVMVGQILAEDAAVMQRYFAAINADALIAEALKEQPELASDPDALDRAVFGLFTTPARNSLFAIVAWYIVMLVGLLGMKRLLSKGRSRTGAEGPEA